MINFSAWSIHRPLPAILLFTLLMVSGLFAFHRLPVTDISDVEVPVIMVSVNYVGATPNQMEAEVTRKVEDAVAGVKGVQHITSTIQQGNSVTIIEFDIDDDIQAALADVRDAVSRIRTELPQDINDPVVTRLAVSDRPVAIYAVESDSLGESELSWLVDDTIAKRMLEVRGVGAVKRQGGVDREIRVDLKPDRLLAFGITAGQISQQLRSTQAEQAGGTIRLGDGQQNVRVVATVDSAVALSNFPIALNDGRSVRLSELGTVADRFADRTSLTLLDGRPVVGIQIQRTKGANELDISDGLAAAVTELQTRHPTIKFTLVSSKAPQVRETFRSSMEMLVEGAILAIIVVFLFLRDWRATWISAVALPLSIVPTFLVMWWYHIPLSILPLLALSLVVGLLVDDAIVEVENIVRHLREGKTPKRAALDAAQEIGLAVIGTSLTLAAIFVPVAFMPGVAGRFFKEFAITCAASVLLSLVVARLITPMMAAYQLRARPEVEHRGTSMQRYLSLVSWTLANRGKTLLSALSIFIIAIIGYALLPSGFLSAEDHGELSINVAMPPGADINASRAAADQVQKILREEPEVMLVYNSIGIGNAVVKAKLTDFSMRKRTQQELQKVLTPRLSQVAGARASFGVAGWGEALNVMLVSDNPQSLEPLMQAAAQLEREVRTIAKIGGTSSSAALLKPEIAVRPDFARMAELGATSAVLSDAIRIGTTGDVSYRLPKLSLPSRQIPIRIQLDADALKDIDTLRLLRVPTRTGSVPLNSIANIELSSGPAQISRYDRRRNVTISIPLHGEPLGVVYQKVSALPALKNLPVGITEVASGELANQKELGLAFGIAMITGVFCVYGVLALLFNDLLQPITILLALPLSIGGAVAALAIGGYSISMPAMIGLLMLMGIAVKNSILLVDYAVMGEEQGLQRNEALLDACSKRARPIVMTSIAMGAGMLPAVLNLSGHSGFRTPMSLAVMGGLVTSTILSLLVIPAAYTYIADFESWTRRWRHRFSVGD